jgi:hypothetical protein
VEEERGDDVRNGPEPSWPVTRYLRVVVVVVVVVVAALRLRLWLSTAAEDDAVVVLVVENDSDVDTRPNKVTAVNKLIRYNNLFLVVCVFSSRFSQQVQKERISKEI